ncbi:MAG: TIGR01244 family sulfur transferase [Rhodomicrobiaceae bacterium]|jgi:uncharacterized protein (TIGR01244 family)
MDYRVVTSDFAVAPQISPEHIKEIKALGYVAIINNRPDHEVEGQPTSEEIRVLVEEAGLDYYFLPIQSGSLPMEAVEQTKELIAKIDGPAFAYCRSGTRSITLWAFSKIGQTETQEVINSVEKAGYNLPFLQNYL